jgi:FAD binding domain
MCGIAKKLPDTRAGTTLLSSVQAIRIIAMGRALVIGGSLGGLFAGLLLRQSGWDVAVFERSSGDLASRGVGIGTHVEQFEIMRRLGITVDERIGVALTSRICLDRDGVVIARLPFEKTLTSWALLPSAAAASAGRVLPAGYAARGRCPECELRHRDFRQWHKGGRRSSGRCRRRAFHGALARLRRPGAELCRLRGLAWRGR